MDVAEAFGQLSPEGQRVVRLLSRLPARLADPGLRREVRVFLDEVAGAGVEPQGVERARAVLAAYEGVLHAADGGGETVELVRAWPGEGQRERR